MKHNTTTAPAMKKFPSRRDLWNAHKTIARIVDTLAQALEIANRADNEAKRDDEREAGNLPAWAGSTSVYGDIRTALNRVISDFYGVTLTDLNVNWGGTGSFSRDIFEALNSALVTQQTAAHNANDITAEIEAAFRTLIHDHGSATKALHAVSDAWVTSNWINVSRRADHLFLHSLKARGVEWLVKTFYSLA